MFSTVLSVVLVLLKGFAALSVLILFHELGHFLIAKAFGVYVEEFGLGLPPRVFGKKFGETIYSFNWLPIGGFVKLHGETLEEKAQFPERSFSNKSKLARVLISLAGIVFNFILALVCFAIVYSFLGIPKETGNVRITDISAQTPAQVAGLLVGDIVRKVDKDSVNSTADFISLVESRKGKSIKIEIERTIDGNTKNLVFPVTPRANPPEGEGPLGVSITSTEIYYPPIWQRPFVGAYFGAIEAFNTSKAVVLGLFGVATEVSKGQVPKGTVGPFGIFALIEYVSRLGIVPLINFMGIISINLAIVNLIPFPPLDGSRVLFVGLELIFKKKMLPKIESTVQSVGMIILILLMIAITAREIPTAIRTGNVNSFVEAIIK